MAGMSARSGPRVLHESRVVAVAAIWLATALESVLAPDMVTGSRHEHLPMAVMTVWIWAAVATAFALMTPRDRSLAHWSVAVSVVWLAVLLVGVAAPLMVTGTDPTRIPLGVLVGAPAGAVVTGLLSMRQATGGL